jgi:O-antigen/teichoic acid export membrane protein
VGAAVDLLHETEAVTIGELAPDTLIPTSGPASVRGLARAAMGSFGLSVANTATTILTTIALARLMDLDAFGTYSWVVATLYVLTVPAILGVDRLLVREVAVYLGRGALGNVRGIIRRAFQLVTATCAVITVIVVLWVWAAGPGADPATATALTIGVLALPALALAWVAQSALIGLHHVVVGQLSELLLRPSLLLALVIIAALVSTAPIGAPLAAALFTASALAAALIAFALLRRRMSTTLSADLPAYESRQWLAAALGLVMLSGTQFLNSQVGVVMLGTLDQAESAGLYAVAQRGALLVAFPLLALNAALAPTAARLWAGGEVRQLQRLVTLGSRAVLLASVPVALVFVLSGEALLELVFGRSFSAAGQSLAILSLGQIANAATGSVAMLLMMTGNQRRAGFGIAAGLMLNLGLGIVLIPTLHATGAAIAAATGIVVSNLFHVWMARSALGIDATALGIAPRGRS